MISVSRIADGDPMEFSVLVRKGGNETRHTVVLAQEDHIRLAGDRPPEACIVAAFHFLMDREPQEAILARFEIPLISRYFPEFERELPNYLSAR